MVLSFTAEDGQDFSSLFETANLVVGVTIVCGVV